MGEVNGRGRKVGDLEGGQCFMPMRVDSPALGWGKAPQSGRTWLSGSLDTCGSGRISWEAEGLCLHLCDPWGPDPVCGVPTKLRMEQKAVLWCARFW